MAGIEDFNRPQPEDILCSKCAEPCRPVRGDVCAVCRDKMWHAYYCGDPNAAPAVVADIRGSRPVGLFLSGHSGECPNRAAYIDELVARLRG